MKSVRKTTVRVDDQDGRYAMSEAEQREAADQLEDLDKQQLDLELGGVEAHNHIQPDMSAIQAQRAQISSKFADVEAASMAPTTVDTQTDSYVKKPSAFGKAVGKVPLFGKLLDTFDIVQTTDRKVEETRVDITRAQKEDEEAKFRSEQYRQAV